MVFVRHSPLLLVQLKKESPMQTVSALVAYAIDQKMMTKRDVVYVTNAIVSLFNEAPKESYYQKPKTTQRTLRTFLDPLLDLAFEKGLMAENTIHERDRFEALIMDLLMPRPSELEATFQTLYAEAPKAATDYFYQLSKDSNYIKVDRLKKNKHFSVKTAYGELKATINLAKPEKDPKSIALAMDDETYPQCLLCKEYVGLNLAGKPPRKNHRSMQLSLAGEVFHFQYSPYVYYNEHAIVIHESHIPMNVSKKTYQRLFDFVDQFPHYFLGSNAGLPIVGGSILSHEHYQGGHARFPIDDARVLESYRYGNVLIEKLLWPLSVLRFKATDKDILINVVDHFEHVFRTYHNEALGIISKTGVMHNAITPIARKVDGEYQMTIALRNNVTSEKYPDGVFHTHPNHQHIKKENLGLIEVMGLGILPGRLDVELPLIVQYLNGEEALSRIPKPLQPWAMELKEKVPSRNLLDYVYTEAARVFVSGLEDAAVFPHTEKGHQAFNAFIQKFLTS